MVENVEVPTATDKVIEIDQKKVLKQIEYYFGNSNLQRDTFLKAEIDKDTEGWVTLAVMMQFKRLASLVNNEVNNVVETINQLKSTLLEISEDKLKIRRVQSNPIPVYDDTYRRLEKARTCYVKGFEESCTLDELQGFFEKWNAESVYMRRVQLSKQFKGSVFVTFATQDDCDNFMKEPDLKWKETVLARKTKEAYYSDKKDEENERKGKPKREKKEPREEDTDAVNRIVKFTGVTDETIGREEIIDAFGGEVDFTHFERGKNDGTFLLKPGQSAEEAVKALENNPVKIRSADEVLFAALDGKEALECCAEILSEKEKLFERLRNKKSGRGRKFGGRGGNRGGRDGNRGRDNRDGNKNPKNTKITFDDNDEPVQKKSKVEA